MDDSVKMILKKLDDIDARLKSLEKPIPTDSVKNVALEQDKKVVRDPLFAKAVEVINQADETSSKQIADSLKIDVKRAEAIMDQLEAAGLGSCYMKEV